jgi:Fe-S-cluster containining protein
MDYLDTLRYSQRLAQLKRERPAACLRHLTHCIRCGVCCYHSPAQLSPEDLKRLAAHHSVPIDYYFAHYCAVSLINEQLSIVLLRSGQSSYGGQMLPPSQRLNLDTPCLYLDTANGCRVHEHKPLQCLRAKCWKPNHVMEVSWRAEDLKALGWSGEDV